MSCNTGWYNLAEAQFKMHRYSDSATSCSQGTVSMVFITIAIQVMSQQYVIAGTVTPKEYL